MISDDREYGFRHDPTDWIKSDDSLAAARVRTMVYRQPRPGDDKKLNAKVDEILAGQRSDGSFGDSSKATAATLLEALEHGAARDRREVQRAGILRDLRRRRFYVKPSEAKRLKAAAARRRRRRQIQRQRRSDF